MVSKAVWMLALAGTLSLTAFGQNTPKAVPIPGDPLELVTGPALGVDETAGRTEAMQLIGRSRANYSLRGIGRPYDVKVSFTVNSGGQTEHDGAWKMEDLIDPRVGFRWTAQASDGYAITRVSLNGAVYGEETGSYIPLRLHEVRAAIFDPIPPAASLKNASIRTFNASQNGKQLTCVLLSGPGNSDTAVARRRWDETEECMDAQTGLLYTHSQVPGRYYAYDYTDAPQLAGHILPRKVTITEGGKAVTTILVESVTGVSSIDTSQFAPTEAMKAGGRPVTMGGALKMSRVLGGGTETATAAVQAVCVFGLLTSSGQLVEAHSLQPSNPNSQAAIAAAKQIDFSRRAPSGGQPQQHFVFVIERIAASQ